MLSLATILCGRFFCPYFSLFLLPCLFYFFVPDSSKAEGWLQPKGKTLSIYSLNYYIVDDYYDHRGRKRPLNGEYVKAYASWYSEGGVTDWLTIGTSTEFQYILQTNNNKSFENWGIANTEFFARVPVYKFPSSIISAQALVKLPPKYNSDAPIGDTGDPDMELGLQGGHSFKLWKKDHYMSGSAAYRKRTGSASNQLRFHALAGFRTGDIFEIIPELSFTTPAGGTLLDDRFLVGGESDYKQLKAETSLLINLHKNYALLLGLSKDIYSRSTGQGYGGRVALWRRH